MLQLEFTIFSEGIKRIKLIKLIPLINGFENPTKTWSMRSLTQQQRSCSRQGAMFAKMG
jgi:hypothetical protein